MGWKHHPKSLSAGDYVFAYNLTTKKIESGFRVKLTSNNNNPLWFKETQQSPQKVVYKFRWYTDLICNNLEIDCQTIRRIEPFKSNKRASFQKLVIRDSATSLDKQVYKPLRDFLLSKCRSTAQVRPNTIDDVIDKTSLPRETIEEIETLLNEKKTSYILWPSWN